MLRFVSLFALLPILLHAQVRVPAITHADLIELEKLAAKEPDARKLTEATHGRYPTAYINGRCMVGFLAKASAGFDQDVASGAHVSIGSRIGDVVSLRVDAYHLEEARQIPGVSYIELAGKAKPELDRVRWTTRVDSVHRGINLPMPYSGRDVLIGICDWGFDYTHPDLYDTLLTQTRIRAAWDQYKQSGPAPSGFPYGTEYSTPSELLAAQTDTSNIYSHHYHGTHVAGIAGGSGAGTVYRGMAYESQFLLATWLIDAAAVMDAYVWMKQIADADQQRLVINQSWGLHWIGTLDGNSLISQAIDAMAQQGVVFVNSAGNNGDYNFHIRKDFAGDTLRSRIQFYSYSANPNMWGQSISMWGETGHPFSAGFIITSNNSTILSESPWYNTATQPAYLDSFMVQGTDTVFFNLAAEASHPLNSRPFFRLRVKSTSANIKVALKATAPQGVVHFWNVTELSTDVGNWGQDFQAAGAGWVGGDSNYGISEPACTNNLIAVGAFTSEYLSPIGTVLGGPIATFSSFGPTLDERVKPDITAPGVSVSSAVSSFTDASYTISATVDFQGETYHFTRISGTSMSSPAVAGICALILQADPTLTAAEVKDLIRNTARTDQYTGAIPAGGSLRWGMGKVNAYRAITEALGIVSVPATGLLEAGVWPNPSAETVRIAVNNGAGGLECVVSDMAGRVVLRQRSVSSQVELDIRGLDAGCYQALIEQGGQRAVARFVKH